MLSSYACHSEALCRRTALEYVFQMALAELMQVDLISLNRRLIIAWTTPAGSTTNIACAHRTAGNRYFFSPRGPTGLSLAQFHIPHPGRGQRQQPTARILRS